MKAEKVAYAIISTIIAVVFSVVSLSFDVATAGPAGSSVGLSHINYKLYTTLSSNDLLYYLTRGIGCLAITIAIGFVIIGVLQFAVRRQNSGIDKIIVALFILYLVMAVLFICFDLISLNTGPTIMPHHLFAMVSYPASWMVLIIVICGSGTMIIGDYCSNRNAAFIRTIYILMMLVAVVGSLLSGEYWVTDVLAGILVSNAILGWFAFAITSPKIKNTPRYNIEEVERKLFANQKTALTTRLKPRGPRS